MTSEPLQKKWSRLPAVQSDSRENICSVCYMPDNNELTIISGAVRALKGLGAAVSVENSVTLALVENETTRSCQSRSFKLFASESFIWQRRRANTDQTKIAHKYGRAIKSPNSVKENRAGGREITLSRWPIISRGARWVFRRPFWGLLGEMWTLCSQIVPASLSVSWLSFTCVLFENRVNKGRTRAARGN